MARELDELEIVRMQDDDACPLKPRAKLISRSGKHRHLGMRAHYIDPNDANVLSTRARRTAEIPFGPPNNIASRDRLRLCYRCGVKDGPLVAAGKKSSKPCQVCIDGARLGR